MPRRRRVKLTSNKEPFNIFTALWLFGLFGVSDFIYALYVILVNEGQALLGAIMSSAILGLSFIGVQKFLRQPWYIVPIILGALVGAFISISLFK